LAWEIPDVFVEVFMESPLGLGAAGDVHEEIESKTNLWQQAGKWENIVINIRQKDGHSNRAPPPESIKCRTNEVCSLLGYHMPNLPFYLFFQVNGVWALPDVVCDFYIAMDVICSTSSIFNLVAISIDR